MAQVQTFDLDAARDRLLLALRPRVALVSLVAHMMSFGDDPEDRIAATERVPHAVAAGTGEAALSANTVRAITALDADPQIRALRQRLFDAGVSSAFEPDQDANDLWTSLVLRCPREALPRLEALAADDAGIDPADREEVSAQFTIYMLRNHHPQWQANREKLPDVGDSPYTPPQEWNLLGT